MKTIKTPPLETGGETNWEEEFIEKGAALEHARWARWQNYLHTFLVWNNEIQMWTLPHEKKEWWDSEIRTPYSQLTEKQKESDRKEVREYLPIINKIITHTTEQTARQTREEVLRDILSATEPYEGSKWLNNITPENLRKVILSEQPLEKEQ